MVFQHLQSVHLGCRGAADGGPSLAVVFGNELGRTGRVFTFHCFHGGMVGQESAALHQGYGMGMHFLNAGPVVIGQTADAVGDVQFMFSHNSGARVAQQLVVVEQTACNGVLDGGHSDDGGVSLDVLKHLFEGGAADELHLLALEMLVGSDVVKRSQQTLYGYSLHALCFLVIVSSFLFCIKNPASDGLKRDCVVMFILLRDRNHRYLKLNLHATSRSTVPCKVKVKAVKVCVCCVHALDFYSFTLQK